MTGSIATRLAKRKLDSTKEVICLSSDDDDSEPDDDDDESIYTGTENDESDEEDGSNVETEDPSCDSSSISGEEDLIDLSSDSDGPNVKRTEEQLNHEIVKLAGNTAKGVDVPFKNNIQAVKMGIECGRALNESDEISYAEAMNVITGGGDMKKLTVEQCRAYLRKFCLRRTGSKEVLLKRIQEHIELKDGGGLAKYPRSMFVVNCTGDACTGDIVLFKQKVYGRYDIVSRSSGLPPLGKRVVAGRIVKESYGEKKQQHTFTMEVLWSTGVKALPPLYPLIIKGRNLYRLKTFRQYWSNEEERRRVLEEKHARGTVARRHRVLRISGRKHSGHTQKRTLKSEVNVTKSASNTHKRRRVDVTKGRAGNTVRRQGGSIHTTKMTMPTASTSKRGRTHGNAYEQNHGLSTVFVSIKASLAGLVIGTGGTNIKLISNVSGAKLYVVDDARDPSLRLVQISGKPEQIQVARELVLQRVMNTGSFQAV